MGVQDHAKSAEREVARCCILTVSDSRTAETDESGRAAAALLEAAGHSIMKRRIVPNVAAKIVVAAQAAIVEGADLVVAVGGTGVSPKDVTVEAVRQLMTKELPGFGELFRIMSYKAIGTASIMSRATLGTTAEGKLIAATPGSPAAVQLALKDVLVPQLKHLLRETRKHA